MALIKLSSTSVSSSGLTQNFTDQFSADYDAYYIVLRNFDATSAANTLYFRFLDSSNSVINSGSLYQQAILEMNSSGSFSEGRLTAEDRIRIGTTKNNTNQNMNGVLYVFTPFNSGEFSYVSVRTSNTATLEGKQGHAVLKQAAQHNGFQIASDTSGRNITQGIAITYGVKK